MSETIKTNESQDGGSNSEWDVLTQEPKTPELSPDDEQEPPEPEPNTPEPDTAGDGNETEQSAEEIRDPRVESLAIPLARDYAEKNYPKLEDGTFKPAWRGLNGEKAYKNKSPQQLVEEGVFKTVEEAQAVVIDIANTPYDQYSEYWKEQNRGGAEYLISLVDEIGAEEILKQDFVGDESARQKYGDLVHNNWLSRNEWVKDPNTGDPKLAVPYSKLDPVEQQKDIDQLVILQKWIREQSAGEAEA